MEKVHKNIDFLRVKLVNCQEMIALRNISQKLEQSIFRISEQIFVETSSPLNSVKNNQNMLNTAKENIEQLKLIYASYFNDTDKVFSAERRKVDLYSIYSFENSKLIPCFFFVVR